MTLNLAEQLIRRLATDPAFRQQLAALDPAGKRALLDANGFRGVTAEWVHAEAHAAFKGLTQDNVAEPDAMAAVTAATAAAAAAPAPIAATSAIVTVHSPAAATSAIVTVHSPTAATSAIVTVPPPAAAIVTSQPPAAPSVSGAAPPLRAAAAPPSAENKNPVDGGQS